MNNRNTKKAKLIIKEEEDETRGGSVYLDDNVLSEVLRHVDARSLAMAGCVSKQWQKMARDERLWELICTKQWVNTGCAEQQLRSLILALGGFRRLHALYLWPLSKPHAPPKPLWGKDEVHLSLSLLSIRYFEKMNNFLSTKKNT
ncbi:hypothetical protein AAZX31_14G083800 [Glycine max]|uniref:F-box domain-containing protein n=2 Tax=Glycine subgen. Soja TaxID=1462606 RepID=I1M8R5_SOYBN|nr:F-box protein GID2 [Glycine max]XP_028199936.1 F-box protein GID2-like [Glycine soja]KAG4953568.1 hypothetical protein JHK87_039162 [Glycine soja]KAG4962498.1 hypothetical protein JHK86_039366 [Glycine max]KAH1093711.1 hypothetical protein GYH30_039439 [Glycine max]KAH1212211.1 F-box protein GID2 [Glycine max]KRH15421.1 hypothetical protein GLYMA_14G086600v4 [Glycine max]|eukprot:XP_014622108.1 F-box protein GID2 [Glycine max]